MTRFFINFYLQNNQHSNLPRIYELWDKGPLFRYMSAEIFFFPSVTDLFDIKFSMFSALSMYLSLIDLFLP